MFCIINDLRHILFQINKGIVDQFKVFFKADAQSLSHMKIPGLAEDGDSVRFRLNQCLNIIVFIRSCLGAAGRTKGRHLGVAKRYFFNVLEKCDIFRIGPRPAPLDIVNAEFIKFLCNANFVRNEKRNIFSLRTVTQSCVVQKNSTHYQLPVTDSTLYKFYSTET